jgi:hypothetical protein
MFNEQTDTPEVLESAVPVPQVEEGSVDDIFNQMDRGSEAFRPVEEAPLPEATPTTPVGEATQDNDQVRYQYWQSQADKVKAQNEQLLQEREQIKHYLQNQAAVQQNAQAHTQVPTPEPEVERFPDPPERPEKPRGFNREEAYGDPASESAAYLDSVEEWRDNTAQYNTLKTEYNAVIQRDYVESQERAREVQRASAEKKQVLNAQLRGMATELQAKYGATQEQVVGFMKSMSNRESLSLDNLWQLHNMNQGTGLPGAVPGQSMTQPPAAPQPSPEFNQAYNTQQVPSPMGVLPSSSNQASTRRAEDIIMDSFIDDYKGSNPFG